MEMKSAVDPTTSYIFMTGYCVYRLDKLHPSHNDILLQMAIIQEVMV